MTDDSEIVDLDACPAKPALITGGIVAFALTLFPMSYALCCMPLAIGGFVATSRYIFKYGVRLDLKYGMKIAILACLCGFGASTLFYDLLWLGIDYRIGLDWYVNFLADLAESAPESQRDQLLESIELLKEQSLGLGVVIQQVFTLILTSGIGGAMGGALASSIFKKGKVAQ